MKKNKLFLNMLAMAGVLFATSCTQDDLTGDQVSGNYVNAKFTIETPTGIQTRVIGDGTTVDKVRCAVFGEDGNEIEGLKETIDIKNRVATFETRLVKGQKYKVAFFAYNEAAGAYDVTDMKNITVNDEQKSNLEGRDAFTNNVDVSATETMSSVEKTVYLYRPFAQLNIGSYPEDIEAAKAAGITVTQSTVTVTNVYKAFNAYDDAVVGETSEATFDLNTIPTEALKVDTDGDGTTEDYEYLALNYMLVGDKGTKKDLTDVKFTWQTADGKKNASPIEFKNVPVQRNYRTNIIGYILTNPAKFNIIVDQNFEKDEYNVLVWDGKDVKEPIAEENVWTVKSAAEWAYLAENGTQSKNIKLAADLDFGGNAVKNMVFYGEFDGQGHKMSNMTLTGGSGYSIGLLQGDALQGDVTVKNVTLENVTIDSKNPNQGYAGVIYGDVQNAKTVTLDGVKVENANIKGVCSVAGLVGLAASETTVNVNNCSVNGSKISNYGVNNESGFVAGLVGRPVGTVNVTNSTVTNTTIDAYYAPRRGEASIQPVVGGKPELTAGADVVVNKTCYVASNATFEAALKQDIETINIALGADVAATIGARYNLGGKSTKAINIEGNDNTIKFNGDNTDWNSIGVTNNGTLTIKNAKLTNNKTTGTWNQGDIWFWCPVTLEKVTTKQIALKKGATLKDVTINVAAESDAYALWIEARDQKVNLNNVTINAATGGHRGIAIKDQYVTIEGGIVGKVTLNVTGGKVASKKKAAIIVTSDAGADINISNFDISGVEADTKNAVWYDKGDGKNINVTGGTAVVEP